MLIHRRNLKVHWRVFLMSCIKFYFTLDRDFFFNRGTAILNVFSLHQMSVCKNLCNFFFCYFDMGAAVR